MQADDSLPPKGISRDMWEVYNRTLCLWSCAVAVLWLCESQPESCLLASDWMTSNMTMPIAMCMPMGVRRV